MEKKETPAQRKRSERNAKIKDKINEQILDGYSKSVSVSKVASRFGLTIATIYNILKEGK